ncbi:MULTISPECIES: LPS export ABC transporter permease LptG [unclassified Acinetobacter]|uniref:LPS export ABC transporter permease LptG n=1 Tax=unclassified Acinetobacter TaxID=196816 RepID=UPI00190A71B9|nr:MULTISPECIES: LPS export ABC transporter permease LptG [unclassified Acinetobacter]MBK0064697.1 LPS export ABC transporter permease LptG [Acinetobacter sp. S55]MBK0068065.1 LPS export ABC transporter permease LptG [Acinetobacter sp. S54]
MLSQKILARYVTKTTTLMMLGTLLVLVFLFVLFSYVGELGSLKAGYGAWDAFKYVMWDSPHNMIKLIPIAALIGAVLGLGSMASNSELIVMRGSGVSLWRIVGWVMRPAFLLVILSFCISEWVIPLTSEQAKGVKNQNTVAALGEVRGYWTKEGNNFYYIDYANSKGNLNGIQVAAFDQDYRLNSVVKAQTGQFIQDGEWILKNNQQLNILQNGDASFQNIATKDLSLALQPKFVHMVTLDPEELAPSELVGFMRYMREYSQIPKTYQLAFWKKVGSPFSLIALTLIACSFIFGPLRQQSMGFRLVIALFVGLSIFYLQDFLGYASLVYSPSPAWFIFIPILLMFGAGSYLLYRAR